ncbi:hypothetical protein [Plantibacter sp. YIM 135347]|uniref:DUF7882 family protein n=1 Tax=Plantibacter sp. YIM 135347 TaxID=3423919 RepID=UPI003D33CF5B
MGTIIYGSGERQLHLDDRTLAHLKSIVVMKLRRQESFLLSWQRADEDGPAGRVSLWVHPSIPLEFQFEEAERPTLNREWLEALMEASNRSGDLQITAEPGVAERPVVESPETPAVAAISRATTTERAAV